MTLAELVNDTVKLVSLPAVYLRARELLDDPNIPLNRVGEVVASDPGMTARLLRIANSAYFGFAARIETPARAVAILGTQQVHDLLLATSLATVFSGTGRDAVNMEQFWRDSMRCALAARLTAAHCNVLDSERLFVEGLLHDIGHLLMFEKVPSLTHEAMVQARHEGTPLHVVERDLLGFDYAQAGAALLGAWNLPEGLCEAVRWHVEPKMAERFALEAAIVHIARQLTCPVHADDAKLTGVAPEAWEVTRLDPDLVVVLRNEVDAREQETMDLILGSQVDSVAQGGG